jgi:hypothetical protein
MGPMMTEWSGKGSGMVVCLGWGMVADQVRPIFGGWKALVVGVHHPTEWAEVARQLPVGWPQVGISWGVHGMTQPGWVIAGAYSVPHSGVLRLFDRDPDRFMARFWEGYPPHPPVPMDTLREGLRWLQSAEVPPTVSHRRWWHGSEDRVIPLARATQWATAMGTPIAVMPHTTHLSWLRHDRVYSQLSTFLCHADVGRS